MLNLASWSRAARGLCLFGALALLLLCPPARAAFAQNPDARDDAPLGWMAPIGPGGGELADPAQGLLLRVPPDALDETVTLVLALAAQPPAGLPAALELLGAWTLHAGLGYSLPVSRFGAPWQATVRYGSCGEGHSFCAAQPIDEGSLHCLHRPAPGAPWVRTFASVDVVGDLLTCSDAGFGEYAVVARPLQTAGATSGFTLLLPLVRR